MAQGGLAGQRRRHKRWRGRLVAQGGLTGQRSLRHRHRLRHSLGLGVGNIINTPCVARTLSLISSDRIGNTP